MKTKPQPPTNNDAAPHSQQYAGGSQGKAHPTSEKRAHQAARQSVSHVLLHDKAAGYTETIAQVRAELPRSERGFSAFIHRPLVERISDLLGVTIFRPNAILFGGVFAFGATLALYGYAKYAGFTLQGSETIIAFLVGWLAGILFDFFKAMVTGKRD